MMTLEYFFLLLPGEYNTTKTPTTPFCLQVLYLSYGNSLFDIFYVPHVALDYSIYKNIEFTTQNNMLWGEVIVDGDSVDTILFPNEALVIRVIYII